MFNNIILDEPGDEEKKSKFSDFLKRCEDNKVKPVIILSRLHEEQLTKDDRS